VIWERKRQNSATKYLATARNFMDSAEEVDLVSLPIVEDTMTWMFGEEKKLKFPSV
jgi:hypothetical protein